MAKRRQRRVRKKLHQLTAPQVRCLASSVRDKLLLLLRQFGPCSIREVADYFDTYPEGLYHHIKKMIKVGVVVEVGTKRSGRRIEAVYDVIADRMLLKPQPWDSDYIAAVQKLFKAMFAQKAAECLSAVERVSPNPAPNTYVYVRQHDIDLDKKRIAEVRTRMKKLDDWLSQLDPTPASVTHGFFLSICPIEKQRPVRDSVKRKKRASEPRTT